MAFCCVSCCCYRDPPQAGTPCCHHCCHRLIRGSSGGSGVAACGRSSSSSSSGGSGAILFLVAVVILLLFARPPCWRPSPFRRPLLFLQSTKSLHSTPNGCCCLHLSVALFVVACHPAIINDCVASRRPLAHLVALVSPAAVAFVALRSSKAPSSSLPSWRHCHC